MKGKRFLCLLIANLLIAGSLATPAGAVVTKQPNTQAITRATDRIEASIPADALAPLGDSVSLDSGEVVTFNCSYTPRSANVEFGYIGPDGLFYGLSGSNGYINKGIRVSEPGSYTLAIWNLSNTAVTVRGTINY